MMKYRKCELPRQQFFIWLKGFTTKIPRKLQTNRKKVFRINVIRLVKSDNLQHNTLGRWDDRLIEQEFDVPIIIIFHNFLQNSLQKSFIFILVKN
jgi:hypothetical protein